MSMNNKQRWMGGIVLLGGGTLLAALLFKGAHEIKENKSQESVKSAQQQVNTLKASTTPRVEDMQMQSLQPVTLDIETEKRLLEEQKRNREKAIADQEEKTQKYLAQQQQAEAAAAKKAAQEYAQINARRAKEQAVVNMPPDATTEQNVQGADEKKLALEAKQKAELEKKAEAKKQAELKEKERKRQALEDEKKAEQELKKKAEREQQELKKKAEREQVKREQDEKLKLQQKQEEKQKEKAQLEADAKHKVEQSHLQTQNELDHKKKADANKAREIMKDDSSHKKWMVQVALAGNQANADTIIAKLKAKGYKTTTSPTSKGIRIMVGPSKNKEQADSIRKKIQTDASLNMPSAWVIDWVPLEER